MKATREKKSTNPQIGSLEARLSNNLFSYEVKKNVSNIVISQKETSFHLTVEMDKLEQTLRVTQFKLSHNVDGLIASEELHDAGVIEIVLQGLTSLFSYAYRHEMEEILFLLPQEEALQIVCFEGLFEDVYPLSLGQEKRMALTLSCAFYDFFVNQIKNIKTQLQQALWARQRENNVLKNYLQSRHKGGFSILQNSSPTELHPSNGATIINFPIRKKNSLNSYGQEG